MKTMRWIAVCLGAVLLSPGLQAAPMGDPSSLGKPMFNLPEPYGWTVGGSFVSQRRAVELDDDPSTDLKADHYLARLGYEPISWLALFAQAGVAEANLAQLTGERKLSWAVGGRVTFFDYDMVSPYLHDGRFRVSAAVQYSDALSEDEDREVRWKEFLVAAPGFSYEMFAGEDPDREEPPYSLVLYAAPLFSSMDGHYDSFVRRYDLKEKDSFGALMGVDLYLTPRLSIGWEGQYLGDFTHAFSAAIQF